MIFKRPHSQIQLSKKAIVPEGAQGEQYMQVGGQEELEVDFVLLARFLLLFTAEQFFLHTRKLAQHERLYTLYTYAFYMDALGLHVLHIFIFRKTSAFA